MKIKQKIFKIEDLVKADWTLRSNAVIPKNIILYDGEIISGVRKQVRNQFANNFNP